MVLQMKNRFKEGCDLPKSWGLLVAQLYPASTRDSNPSSDCREYVTQDCSGEALGSLVLSCFQLHYLGLCYHMEWRQGSGNILKAFMFVCAVLIKHIWKKSSLLLCPTSRSEPGKINCRILVVKLVFVLLQLSRMAFGQPVRAEAPISGSTGWWRVLVSRRILQCVFLLRNQGASGQNEW